MTRSHECLRREAAEYLAACPTTSPATLSRALAIGWRLARRLLVEHGAELPSDQCPIALLGHRRSLRRTCAALIIISLRRLRRCAAQS